MQEAIGLTCTAVPARDFTFSADAKAFVIVDVLWVVGQKHTQTPHAQARRKI